MKRKQVKDPKQIEFEFETFQTQESSHFNTIQVLECFSRYVSCFNADLRVELLTDNIGAIKRRCL